MEGIYFARKDVSEGTEGVVQRLVVNGLVQVLDEDVSHPRATEGGVALGPHDAAGTPLNQIVIHGVERPLGCKGWRERLNNNSSQTMHSPSAAC